MPSHRFLIACAVALSLTSACVAGPEDSPTGPGGKADDPLAADASAEATADAGNPLDASDAGEAIHAFDLPTFEPSLLQAVDTRDCVAGSFAHLEPCAIATYQKFWDRWQLEHGMRPTLGDVLTAVYRGELFTVHGFGPGVRAVALEGFARFFWRAIGDTDITPDRLVVFLGAMHAWYLYGPSWMGLRADYLNPEAGLRDLVRGAITDPSYSLGAVAGRPVDWANWGQGKKGFSDFKDGVVAGQPVPLVIRYCSQTRGFDYYFAIVAPGQSSFAERPPSTAGAPIPGDSTCGIYIQNCPACP